ncbi:SIMPL domain-containing protein [Synechococcus sp. CS-1325]|uniref:SIMPL domain-containing protein n=1 Tax=unclassified Synechococcus TaxID=2626047 RepID=UPI000DAF5FAC|nr:MULTISPECIES: SIMPL domain-containing protein [unclassified Synechococcus]MCT0200086.1 SIMPL domain-containing protein [Synechococcus sp. CS-1325]MCT0212626.1 SIMPL domain-containing protein [Synechococcus sp. CS-1326]MCT0233635.1 SIMPL domain-containing protein [Synechococcus sp. CS-1327]PZV00633.1 MAG: SIMPL domain-containing protein [Cyanobium sp.]
MEFSRRIRCLAAVLGILPFSLTLTPAAVAQQVQLRCDGTLLEASGQAERKRSIESLRLSLALEADAATADGALAALQERLAAVRLALRQLAVRELEVSSPSTWQRPASRNQPAAVQANLQVSGQLPPAQLQNLIRTVGALPGVRLAPVSSEAGRGDDAVVQRQLLREAYQDALTQARELAGAIGLAQLSPLEVQLDRGVRPMMNRAATTDASSPFDPAELPPPTDRTSMLVRFCAH